MRHDVAERFLNDKGYSESAGKGSRYQYRENISVSDIESDDAATITQIRPGGMNTEWIREMTDSLSGSLKDSTFPAVILWQRSGNKYEVVDGLHRMKAYKNSKRRHCDAYVIDESNSPDAVAMLRRASNSLHGQRRSRDEGLMHAEFLIRNLHYTNKDAAFLVNLPASTVGLHIRQINTKKSLMDSGVNADRLTNANLSNLSKVGNVKAREALARLALDARLMAGEIKDIVKDTVGYLQTGSMSDALRHIGTLREHYEERIAQTTRGQTRGPGVRSPSKDISIYLKRVHSALDRSYKDSEWTETSLRETIKMLRIEAKALNAQADKLERDKRGG